MRCAWPAAAAAAFVLAAAAPAHAATVQVNALFAQFAPTPVDALPGDSVEWRNTSQRQHTVTADDGSFDSGDGFEPGTTYSQTFGAPGSYAYHCRLHPGMTGEIDVRRVTLDVLPPAALSAGVRLRLSGRAADLSRAVSVERDTGSGYAPVASAMPAPDGTWSTTVTADATGDYRAVWGADVSTARHLVVNARKIAVRATRHGVRVSVTPPAPGALVVLEEDLRERFGWWPAARRRLDFLSRADFRVRGPARVRVALLGGDTWTPLVTSAVLRMRGARPGGS
jgi:plastocyanin